MVVASLEAGQHVWEQHQMLTDWCFLMTGIVVSTSPRLGGQRVPMTLHGPYTGFGEVPILNREPTMLDYVCVTDVQLIRMPVLAFDHVIATDIGFSSHVLRLAARKAQQQMDLLTLLKLSSPITRTILGLAHIADELSASRDDEDYLDIPISKRSSQPCAAVAHPAFAVPAGFAAGGLGLRALQPAGARSAVGMGPAGPLHARAMAVRPGRHRAGHGGRA